MNTIEKLENALAILKETNEKFKALLSAEEWDDKEIERLIVENPHLPLERNYNMRTCFDKDGLHTGLGERFFVDDFNIRVLNGFYQKKGIRYDMEDDIANVERRLEREKNKKLPETMHVKVTIDMEDNAGATYDFGYDEFDVTENNFDTEVVGFIRDAVNELIDEHKDDDDDDEYGLYGALVYVHIDEVDYYTLRYFSEDHCEISKGTFCGWEDITFNMDYVKKSFLGE